MDIHVSANDENVVFRDAMNNSGELIVALRLPLNVVTIILGCIFSMLFSDFRACGPIRIPTSSMRALTEFFHADAVASVHSLPVS